VKRMKVANKKKMTSIRGMISIRAFFRPVGVLPPPLPPASRRLLSNLLDWAHPLPKVWL